MLISIILAHPDKGSFNHAIAEAAKEALEKNGHNVIFHDLYQEGFEPIISYKEIPKDGMVDGKIKKYCSDLAESEGIIIVHPNWWGQPPAILKGWLDRVIRPGVAYKFKETDSGEGVPIGLLKAKTALVFNTSNTPSEREMKVFGDPLERIWKDCVFGLCGIKNFFRKNFSILITSTSKEREDWLKNTKDITNKYFPP